MQRLMSAFSLVIILFYSQCKTAEEYYRSGIHYDSIFEYNKAVSNYSKAIKKNPSNIDYLLLRAEARYKGWEGNSNKLRTLEVIDYESALRIAEHNNANDSVFYKIYRSRMISHYEMGEYKNTIYYCDYLNRKYHKEATPYLYKYQSKLRLHDTTGIQALIDSALTIEVKPEGFFLSIARTEVATGYYSNAVKHYQESISNGEMENIDYLNLSKAYWLTNNKDSACISLSMYVGKENLTSGLNGEIAKYCAH